MKTKFTLLAVSSSLVLAAPALLAQDTNTYVTNALPLTQTVKYQKAFENDRSLGEQCLLPPGLKEKLKLTDEQRGELKPIEDDFANTCQQYQTANQPRIDAALARIFHSGIEQRSGESVRRLDITQPNENAIHRFFDDRL
jgi:hypothetical protein